PGPSTRIDWDGVAVDADFKWRLFNDDGSRAAFGGSIATFRPGGIGLSPVLDYTEVRTGATPLVRILGSTPREWLPGGERLVVHAGNDDPFVVDVQGRVLK